MVIPSGIHCERPSDDDEPMLEGHNGSANHPSGLKNDVHLHIFFCHCPGRLFEQTVANRSEFRGRNQPVPAKHPARLLSIEMPAAVTTDDSWNNNTMASLEAIHLVESTSGKCKLENQVQEETVGAVSGKKYVIREDARKFWTSGSKMEGVFGTIPSVDGVEQEKGVFEPMQGPKGPRATEVKIQENVFPSGFVSAGNGKSYARAAGSPPCHAFSVTMMGMEICSMPQSVHCSIQDRSATPRNKQHTGEPEISDQWCVRW